MKLTAIPSPVKWINVPTNEPGHNLRLMREGRRVYAQMSDTLYEGAGTVPIATVPVGYRPNTIHRLLYSELSSNAPSKLVVAFSATGVIELREKKADGPVYFTIEWTTDDAPPPLLRKLFGLVAGWSRCA